MPVNYSIFVLGESQLSISGGGQLDGITQGDGSHLVGKTITLNSASFDEMKLADDDTDFRDNDTNQRLDGAQTIDEVGYGNGTRVEAEYGLTLSDGVHTWQAVGVNVVNSATSYATVEGLAFIGGPGHFPPVGVPLTVVSAQEGPNFQVPDYATPICYARGARIETAQGPRPIEELRAGDRVQTLDSGLQPIRWIGARPGFGGRGCAPVEIPAGRLGATAPLAVSQQHRLLIRGPQVQLMFGEGEVLVPAIHLVAMGAARLLPRPGAEYFHLLLDRHEVILANGLASESLLPGQWLEPGAEADAFFPELLGLGLARAPAARRCLKRHEAAALRAANVGARLCAPRLQACAAAA